MDLSIFLPMRGQFESGVFLDIVIDMQQFCLDWLHDIFVEKLGVCLGFFLGRLSFMWLSFLRLTSVVPRWAPFSRRFGFGFSFGFGGYCLLLSFFLDCLISLFVHFPISWLISWQLCLGFVFDVVVDKPPISLSWLHDIFVDTLGIYLGFFHSRLFFFWASNDCS